MLKKTGWKAVFALVLLTALFCFSTININQADAAKNPLNFQSWLNTTETGKLLTSATISLYRISQYSYSDLSSEQEEMIQKEIRKTLSLTVNKIDRHSYYFNPKEYARWNETTAGHFEGVGIEISLDHSATQKKLEQIIKKYIPVFEWDNEEFTPYIKETLIVWISKKEPQAANLYEQIKNGIVPQEGVLINKIFPGQPAEKAGMKDKAGWFIIEVENADGRKTTKGVSLEEVSNWIRGPDGTKVKLIVMPPQNKKSGAKQVSNPIAYEIVRGNVKTAAPTTRMLTNKIGYIKLPSFDNQAADQFQTVAKNLKAAGMKDMVIDLRNNPGGLLGEALQILSFLTQSGLVLIHSQDETGKKRTFTSLPEQMAPKIYPDRIVILINDHSASASEILTISLKEHGLATVIGETSLGKASIQSVVDLPDGGGLKWTTGIYLSPIKQIYIHEKGIKPDIEITDVPDTPEDKVLQKAIEILSK